MTITITAPGLAGKPLAATISGTHNGVPFESSVSIPEYGVVPEAPELIELHALGGRVNEYPDLATVSDGILRKQHDGTATLDLTDVRGPVTLIGERSDGTPVEITVAQMISKDGWTPGRYYMLETDANGDMVIEKGDYSRDIYVSNDPAALTRASIAAAQTPAIAESAVTGTWLLARDYGKTAEQKVSVAVANLILDQMKADAFASGDRTRTSYWLYLERGYSYNNLRINGHGESPLHPNVVMAFGTGAAPSGLLFGGNGTYYPTNHVFVGVNLYAQNVLSSENWITADVTLTEEWRNDATSFASGSTLYRTSICGISSSQPLDGSNNPTDDWTKGRNIKAGIYISKTFGVLMLDTFWDHNGHSETAQLSLQDGFMKPTGAWENGLYGQPPTQFSHNLYTSEYNADMTWDGLLSMRAASVAGQMRIGGWQFGCTSVADRVAMQNAGAPRADLRPDIANQNGFHSLNVRSVATNPSGIWSAPNFGGARTKGLDLYGPHSVDVDCIALHARDPDDMENELVIKPVLDEAGYNGGATNLWSNIVTVGWDKNRGVPGVAEAIINTITIQRRAGQVLGKERGTIAEYAEHVAGLTPRQRQLEIRAVNRYLLAARAPTLELELEDRTEPQSVIFKPDWRGEGRRLDNDLNLSTKGRLIDGDSLDLHGNYARWVNHSRSLDHLKVRDGGLLHVDSGKLSFVSADAGSEIMTDHAGKLSIDAFDGKATVRGGRFEVAAPSAGSIEVSGRGEMILGPQWTVRDGETLRIVGDLAKIGWDAISAAGALIVEAGGTLEFHATPVIQYNTYAFNAWNPIMNDFLGETSGAHGYFDSWPRRIGDRGDATNTFARIRDMTGTPVVGEKTCAAKYLQPARGAITAIHPAVIGGITAGWRGRNGAATGAAHTILLKAGSIVKLTGGALGAGSRDLTGAGITVTDQGAIKDTGFSVSGGKLTLAV